VLSWAVEAIVEAISKQQLVWPHLKGHGHACNPVQIIEGVSCLRAMLSLTVTQHHLILIALESFDRQQDSALIAHKNGLWIFEQLESLGECASISSSDIQIIHNVA
jgi:hypothetical protein